MSVGATLHGEVSGAVRMKSRMWKVISLTVLG
jgi:hypothetical protein